MYRVQCVLFFAVIALFFSFLKTISAQQLPDKPDVSGTAFFISKDGMAVTDYHVIKASGRILLFDPRSGWTKEARVIVSDPSNDLAVLQADVTSKALPLADHFSQKRGDDVLTLGYPSPQLQGIQQKATFGRINADTGVHDDIRLVQIDVPIQPGNSGGPLLNRKGEVVGVISSRLREGFENVGYATKVDYLHPLLTKEAIAPVSMRASSNPLSPSRIVETSQDSVIMVLGYRQPQFGMDGSATHNPITDNNLSKLIKQSEIDHLQKGADQGNAMAQLRLGVLYAEGRGVPQDMQKAAELWRKSADQGVAWAQCNLGHMYERGRSVPRDDGKAAEWFQKAADQGNDDAQGWLGFMYYQGRGVVRDKQKGCALMLSSAEQGNKASVKFYNEHCSK